MHLKERNWRMVCGFKRRLVLRPISSKRRAPMSSIHCPQNSLQPLLFVSSSVHHLPSYHFPDYRFCLDFLLNILKKKKKWFLKCVLSPIQAFLKAPLNSLITLNHVLLKHVICPASTQTPPPSSCLLFTCLLPPPTFCVVPTCLSPPGMLHLWLMHFGSLYLVFLHLKPQKTRTRKPELSSSPIYLSMQSSL